MINQDKERKAKVKYILKHYKPKTVSPEIINKINRLHPKTRYYKLITVKDIHENMLLCTVTLDLKQQHIVGICLKIFNDYNNDIEKVLLFNPYKNLYWYIKPTKYYLFKAYKNKEIDKNNMYRSYIEAILNK